MKDGVFWAVCSAWVQWVDQNSLKTFVGKLLLVSVTKSGKTLRMGFFAKIAIAIFINSTPLELTFVQVWDRSPVPFPRYSAFCAMTRELLNSRNYGLKALLCARMRSPYTTSTRKSTMGGVCRSNALSEWMATKTARLRCSSASFSLPLEKKFC